MNFFPKPLTGRHVFFMLVGFFGIMLSADVALIYWGLKTHPGEVSATAYEDGLAYNETLDAARAQAARGWSLDWSWEAVGEGRVRLEAALEDRGGAALPGLAVAARFFRPVDDGFDRTVILSETAPGRYAGEGRLPVRGLWRVRIVAQDDEGARFRRDAEIVVE